MKGKTPYLVIATLFILFNVIAFVIPTEKTTSFWIGYLFTVIAFTVQAYVWYATVGKKQDLKSKLLGSSVTYISAIYLVIQFVAFLIFMFVSSAPNWCVILVCVLVLGISAVCMISTNAGTEMITATDKKVSQKRMYIKTLQIDIEMLAEQEQDPDIKEQLYKLAKKVRLSDPMSDDSLSRIEDNISDIVAVFDTNPEKTKAIQEIEVLLTRRNKMVMALKG